jgi:hypothetical protein
MDPEEMLSRATAELESAETELRAAQQRVEELRTIKQGIQLAMQRYGHAVTLPTPSLGNDASVPGSGGGGVLYDSSTASRLHETTNHAKSVVTQSDLLVETLKESGRPTTSMEIRQRLRQRGHELTAEQTRGGLAYLLRKERVVRTAMGVWALPEHATTARNGASRS